MLLTHPCLAKRTPHVHVRQRVTHFIQAEHALTYEFQVYTGEVGKELGLVDAVGELHGEMRRRYGRYVRLENVAEEDRIELSRLLRWLL